MSNPARLLAILLAVAMLAGCRMMSRDTSGSLSEALDNYAASLRWGYANNAAAFLRSRDGKQGYPNLEFDKDVRVTAYTIKNVEFTDEEKTEAMVYAQLSFYITSSGVVKVLADQQLWWYDEDLKRWFLDGEVPAPLVAKGAPK